MDMLVVQGGRPLRGCVASGGAKNAALPLMAAALLGDGITTLRDVPDLVDVTTLSHVLRSLGARVDRAGSNLQIEVLDTRPCVADYELVRRMRASVCVLGPLLGRRRRACVSLPGGCNIGHRPIDLHLKGLRALGAEITIERGYVFARADRLRGTDIYLGGSFGSTVTGTCNVLSAAVLAKGVTTIAAAACEPEVVDLGNLLNAMGARIEGLGTPLLRITGVDQLQSVAHTVIPDRIEAATLMIAAAMTRGELEIRNVCPSHLSAITDLLRATGVGVDFHESSAFVCSPAALKPVDVTALPYPGIPTDVQAQLTALLSLADGISVVTDKVFPDRFLHIPELVRLGAEIRREGASAIIHGTRTLSGACVMASDLRASAALLLAALAAEGESVVRRVYHLDRGYERLEKKLCQAGAEIQRVPDDPDHMPSGLQLALEERTPPALEAADAPPPPKFLRRSEAGRAETTEAAIPEETSGF